MRVLSVLFAMIVLSGVVTAQAPSFQAKPNGNLAQVMRGILFPNSNIIFEAQEKDPADPPKTGERRLYGDVYGGWQAVENAALALSEAAALIVIPGRVCQNGRPVPVQRADWIRFSRELVEVGKEGYKAAQSKNQDTIVEYSEKLTQACANCHDVYRDKPGGDKTRCIP